MVSAGRDPKPDPTAGAATLWAALNLTLEPGANHLCGESDWSYPAVTVEFDGFILRTIVPHPVVAACGC